MIERNKKKTMKIIIFKKSTSDVFSRRIMLGDSLIERITLTCILDCDSVRSQNIDQRDFFLILKHKVDS
jgi:hypothetical protein